MEIRPSYDWELAFTAVILETDRSKLKGRIDTAEAAIENRLQAMNADHGGTAEERLEIETAQTSLNLMRKRVAMPQDSPRPKGKVLMDSNTTHYHIRWSGKEELDWACFPTKAEALKSAKQLARRGEGYTIEEHDGACPRCADAAKTKTRS